MSGRMRLQVDDDAGTAVVYLDQDLTPAQRRMADELLAPVLAEHDRDAVLAVLIRTVADAEAYDRVCRDRGLLL